ncbi:hypothetical protein [Haloarchaeobius iranensis]|uniref:Uncharacterized protein n=1 Tax=Haloarchaeobius iranensis TaxID=996166 RepID=A0A1G9S8E4_9EURY|nr:hypothetical protein [Haloarchaeobius iranensis]SDM31748.1 hypothetical protein SAMN05192554_10110 [Haloarchaeobius iranensis]
MTIRPLMDSNRRRFIQAMVATGLAVTGLSFSSTATRTTRENPTLLVGSLSDPISQSERLEARNSVLESTDSSGSAVGYASNDEPVVAYAFGLKDGVPQEFVGTAKTEAEATHQIREARSFVEEFDRRTVLNASDSPVSVETDGQWSWLSNTYSSAEGKYGSVDFTAHFWRLDVDTGFTEIATVTEVKAGAWQGFTDIPSYAKHDWNDGTVTAHSPHSFDSDGAGETWESSMYVAADGTQHDIDWNYQTKWKTIEQQYSSSEIQNKTATRWELKDRWSSNFSPVHATGSICSFADEPNNAEVVGTVSHDTKFRTGFRTDRVQDNIELEYFNYE